MKPFSSFFLGILGALGALFVEAIALVFSTPLSASAEALSQTISSFSFLFFFAIIAEEFLKFALLRKIISAPSSSRFIIFSALFFGLGFSMLEMGLSYWNYRHGSSFDMLAAAGIVLLHVSTAIVIGYAVQQAEQRYAHTFFLGFIPAVAMHVAYNSVRISSASNQHVSFIAMIIGMIVADGALLALSVKKEITAK